MNLPIVFIYFYFVKKKFKSEILKLIQGLSIVKLIQGSSTEGGIVYSLPAFLRAFLPLRAAVRILFLWDLALRSLNLSKSVRLARTSFCWRRLDQVDSAHFSATFAVVSWLGQPWWRRWRGSWPSWGSGASPSDGRPKIKELRGVEGDVDLQGGQVHLLQTVGLRYEGLEVLKGK